mmetsp:Transcript_5621/g.4402  ORF Transcript_5621/g.4402 Transcript_5621/m.4402 type:complete len:100 (-) Transcript_5621:34-333(-)
MILNRRNQPSRQLPMLAPSMKCTACPVQGIQVVLSQSLSQNGYGIRPSLRNGMTVFFFFFFFFHLVHSALAGYQPFFFEAGPFLAVRTRWWFPPSPHWP